jgi:hypothetical protein
VQPWRCDCRRARAASSRPRRPLAANARTPGLVETLIAGGTAIDDARTAWSVFLRPGDVPRLGLLTPVALAAESAACPPGSIWARSRDGLGRRAAPTKGRRTPSRRIGLGARSYGYRSRALPGGVFRPDGEAERP